MTISQSASKRLDQLTFTRFAAILLVLFYHGTAGFYASFLGSSPIVTALLYSAPTAVSYLYVLSGFVMSLVYFRPNEKFDVVGYWRARFVRIYPLYIISFALISYYYLDGLLRIKPQKILANLFVLQAWIPAYSQSFNYASWSMTVEFFFYALFPFLTMWAYRQSTRKLIWMALGFWAVSQLVYYVLWTGYYPEYSGLLVYFPLFHLNSFVMGVTGGIWYLREGRLQPLKPVTILLVLAGSALLAAGYTVASTVYYPSLPHRLQPMGGLLAPILILFVVSLALDKSWLSVKLLDRPAPVALGETAYAIYILHVPVAWLYERALDASSLSNPRSVFDVTFLPMMMTIGLIAHFYVDTPLRRWLKRMLARISEPLFLLDLGIIALSAFIIFRLRFGDGRVYLSYREMERVFFWSAFFIRPMLSVMFNSLHPASLRLPIGQMARRVFFSATLGSLIVAAVVFTGYLTGWLENFPRSIFALDWLIVLSLSLLARLALRRFHRLQPAPLPA